MTKKYVLTGGPGVGKSSLVLALEQREEAIIREAAEDWIRLQQARGIQEPWKKPDFQDRILELQLIREKEGEKAGYERVFIDRGLLDGLAYYQIAGKEPSEKMRKAVEETQGRYEKIFLIENLGQCKKTEIRREELEQALRLEKLQERNYRELGYKLVRISAGPVGERVEKILKEI